MPRLRQTLAGLLMLGLAAYGATKAYLYYHAEQRFDALIATLRPTLAVRYERVSASVFGDISLHGLEVQAAGGAPARIERLTISDYVAGAAFPRRIHVRAWGMSVPAREVSRWLASLEQAPGPGLPAALRGTLTEVSALGYRDLNGEAWFELEQDPSRGRLFTRLGGKVAGAGRLDLRLTMLGMTPLELLGLLPTSGRFDAFTADYRDASYVSRVVDSLARQRGESPDQVRAWILGVLVATGWLPDEANRDAVAAFLTRPGELQMRLQPLRPLVLSRLQYYRREDLPAVLNLQIRNH